MVKDFFNGDDRGLIPKIIAGIIVFLIAEGISLGIWLVQLGDRMANVEREHAAIQLRLNDMDRDGTRKLAVVQRVQDDVLRRLDNLEGNHDKINR